MFLDLFSQCITEPIIIHIYYILYVFLNFSTSLRLFVAFLSIQKAYTNYFDPVCTNIFLDAEFNFSWKYGSCYEFIYENAKTNTSTKPKESTTLFPSFIILASFII